MTATKPSQTDHHQQQQQCKGHTPNFVTLPGLHPKISHGWAAELASVERAAYQLGPKAFMYPIILKFGKIDNVGTISGCAKRGRDSYDRMN
jgi:hypothetical protein